MYEKETLILRLLGIIVTRKVSQVIWVKDIPTVPHGSMRFHWQGVMWFESLYWYKLYAQSAPIMSWNFQHENIPSLKVEQMLVTCNETIQNDQEVKSDFLLVVDYHDKQKLERVSVEPIPGLKSSYKTLPDEIQKFSKSSLVIYFT